MSNHIPEEKNIQDSWEAGTGNQPENEELLLVEIKEDRGAKTFIYKSPNQARKRESLWSRLWGEKSRNVE